MMAKRNYMPYCDLCDSFYAANGGGHCRGGKFGGCCKTFASDSAFDAHRRDGKCIDVTSENSAGEGWRLSKRGWTNRPEWNRDDIAQILWTANAAGCASSQKSAGTE